MGWLLFVPSDLKLCTRVVPLIEGNVDFFYKNITYYYINGFNIFSTKTKDLENCRYCYFISGGAIFVTGGILEIVELALVHTKYEPKDPFVLIADSMFLGGIPIIIAGGTILGLAINSKSN